MKTPGQNKNLPSWKKKGTIANPGRNKHQKKVLIIIENPSTSASWAGFSKEDKNFHTITLFWRGEEEQKIPYQHNFFE